MSRPILFEGACEWLPGADPPIMIHTDLGSFVAMLSRANVPFSIASALHGLQCVDLMDGHVNIYFSHDGAMSHIGVDDL